MPIGGLPSSGSSSSKGNYIDLGKDNSYDLNALSERAHKLLTMLETAEVNKYDSVEKVINSSQLPDNEKEIMKAYMKEYLNSK